jgi:O-methyltransferase domain/Dimerisation domain
MMAWQKHPIAVRCYTALFNFGSWLQNLPNALTPAPFRLLQIGSAFWQSRALYVAARLDIAGLLAEDILSADCIAGRIRADADAVYRLLRMLAAMGAFEESSPRCFRNNNLSAHLRPDHPQSVRPMILMHNSPEMSRPWFEQLENGIRSGQVPFELVYGQPFYTYMAQTPDFNALFAEAMDSVEALTGDHFATDFDWRRFRRVIDVGGSKGSKALAILKRHSQLTALVVDHASVVDGAGDYWAGKTEPELLSRLSFQAGDLLAAAPVAQDAGDIYLLSAVLHGMSDDDCVRVLRNLAIASAGSGARVAILELVLADSNADLASVSFDMQMLMATRGRERTLPEWQVLLERSDWRLDERVRLRAMGAILLLRVRE